MYIIEALFEYFITILTTGAYLAKITTTIGISDGMTAIISAVASLSGIFQLVSIYLSHKTPVKRWVVPLQALTALMFASIYLIPILGVTENVGIIFFLIITVANALKAIVSPVKINWFMKLVPSHERGLFHSKLTIVSVVGGTLFTLAISALIDTYEERGEMGAVFLILGAVMLLLVILHTIPLIVAKEKPEIVTQHEPAYRSALSLIKNKNFRNTVISYTIYGIASGLIAPFLSTYQINELGFSMTLIAVMDVVIHVIWIGLLAYFGKISVKYKSRDIRTVANLLPLVTFGIIIFTTPKIGVVGIFIYRLFNSAYSAANTASHHKLLFDLTPPEDRTTAIAISAMLVGIFGFLTTLIARPFFDYLQAQDIVLFGEKVYAQQILALISTAILVVMNIYWMIVKKGLKDHTDYEDI